MIDYRELYSFLFNGITDVIEGMEKANIGESDEKNIRRLKELQAKAEELYLSQED